MLQVLLPLEQATFFAMLAMQLQLRKKILNFLEVTKGENFSDTEETCLVILKESKTDVNPK